MEKELHTKLALRHGPLINRIVGSGRPKRISIPPKTARNRELSETILEINGLRGFPFPDPPFTNSHSQLSPGLGSDENDLKISGNIKKINDLRERFAEACHPVSSWFALTLTLSPRRRNGQAPDQVVIMRVR
jgi:hypothetical protein